MCRKACNNVLDIADVNNEVDAEFINHITVLTFLGNDPAALEAGLLNLNEKVYKKFTDYKKFQILALYQKGQELEAQKLKEEIGAFTDMQKWKFVASSKEEIEGFYASFNVDEPLVNLSSTKAFLVDKNVNLRGRLHDEGIENNKLFGYNLNSVAVLNGKLKDDVKVLYYEYYAAFKEKNKNKADRKEVGL